MFDQIHFAITYTTFFAVSLLFTSYMTDVVEFNEHTVCMQKDTYMNLLHYCNVSNI